MKDESKPMPIPAGSGGKMECEEIRARLVAWIDGECSQAEAQQIEAHLAQCVDCAQKQDEYEALRQMAVEWQVESGDAWPQIQSQIETSDILSLREEIQRLRAEMRQLRAEVTDLRAQLAASEAEDRPSFLLPYRSSPSRTLHIA